MGARSARLRTILCATELPKYTCRVFGVTSTAHDTPARSVMRRRLSHDGIARL
jgi:hypothetical protein